MQIYQEAVEEGIIMTHHQIISSRSECLFNLKIDIIKGQKWFEERNELNQVFIPSNNYIYEKSKLRGDSSDTSYRF